MAKPKYTQGDLFTPSSAPPATTAQGLIRKVKRMSYQGKFTRGGYYHEKKQQNPEKKKPME